MNSDEFNKVLKDTSDKIVSVLGAKSDEYVFDGDRLRNFKIAAQIMNSTPEKALISFMTKHITSIFDMVDSLPEKDFPMGLWDEKIIDIINYMILLRALCVERIEGSEWIEPPNSYVYQWVSDGNASERLIDIRLQVSCQTLGYITKEIKDGEYTGYWVPHVADVQFQAIVPYEKEPAKRCVEAMLTSKVRLCSWYAPADSRPYHLCLRDEGESCKRGSRWESCEYGGKRHENRN